MRVTNSMISNRSQVHISNAKNKMLTAEEQYTTMKKIQRPSEDPTIASRSLKFRTTMAQLTQYVEKKCAGCHGLDGYDRGSDEKGKLYVYGYGRIF